MHRSRLTRSILRKTECEIVAVKTIKGKDTIWCHLHVHNSKLLINDIVMRIVMSSFNSFCHSKFSYTTETRPVGRGGSRGFAQTPLLAPKDFIYTAIVHFKCRTGPLVSLLLRITAVQASLVVVSRGHTRLVWLQLRGFVPRGTTPKVLA